MALPITALYGALHAVFNVALAANVSRLRGKADVFIGAGTSEVLHVAIRRHGNHAEYVALALVLMVIAELGGGSATMLHGVGIAFTLGRIAHAIGVGVRPSAPRAIGALLTWVALAVAGIYGFILTTR